MRDGFYTALGTPLDDNGDFIAASFENQVADQIKAGASGLLAMGSMGIQAQIKNNDYVNVAKSVVSAAKDTCPVFVGVMDNSIGRVMDRIDALSGLKIDGVVATAPYYYTATQEEIIVFFESIAEKSPYSLILYDLPGVTKVKITTQTIERLMKHKNIKGIKTGDITTARVLAQSERKRDDFHIFFSGLDIFDIAYQYGFTLNLDGMFSCTPSLASKLYKSLGEKDLESAKKYLDAILMLRDVFVESGVFCGFTYAMNVLGYEGSFSPDYTPLADDKSRTKILDCMRQIGAL